MTNGRVVVWPEVLSAVADQTAHEDDPERAVRAALEMQAVAASLAADPGDAPELKLRIGIATGEVRADRIRATAERDLVVTGDAVNTAARLQGAAEPGTVIVGSSTYAATRDAIEYEELPPLELKGKGLPVAAWRAVASRPDVADVAHAWACSRRWSGATPSSACSRRPPGARWRRGARTWSRPSAAPASARAA